MKFKEIKKRSVYKTWKHKNKKTGIVSYIHQTPKTKISNDEFYHFEISCSQKYCNEQNCSRLHCKKKLQYSSLNHNYRFNNFEDCIAAVYIWHRRKL